MWHGAKIDIFLFTDSKLLQIIYFAFSSYYYLRPMKLAILLMLSLLLAFTAVAQKELNAPMSKVVEASGISKQELYNRAHIWMAKTFPANSFQMQDPASGMLIARGLISYDAPAFNPGTNFSGNFDFLLTIEVKEGRYRYNVEGLGFRAYKYPDNYNLLSSEKPSGSQFGGTAPSKKGWNKIRKVGYAKVSTLLILLYNAMESKDANTEDW